MADSSLPKCLKWRSVCGFLKGCSTWKGTNPGKFYAQATADAHNSPSWLWTDNYLLQLISLEAGSDPHPADGGRGAVAHGRMALVSVALRLINTSAKVDLILRSLMDPNKDQ